MGISIGAVAVGIHSSGRDSRGGPDIPESISTSEFHFVPRASIVSRRLHYSPGGFLRTDLHLKQTMLRPHQVFNRRRVSFPPATTDPSVRQLGCSHFMIGDQRETDSPNMHKGDTYGVPSKYWNGVLPSGRTVNLESTNPV